MVIVTGTTWQTIKDILFPILATNFTATVGHSFLPPWDDPALEPFPRFQKFYRLFIYFLGYVAFNLRSTFHPSISIHNPDGLNGTLMKPPDDTTPKA